MKLKPTIGKLLVQTIIPEDISAGGIMLPTDREGDPKDNPQFGTVLAVGPDMINKHDRVVPMPCKVGDKIVFMDFWSTQEKLVGLSDGRLFIDQVDILAIVEDDNVSKD